MAKTIKTDLSPEVTNLVCTLQRIFDRVDSGTVVRLTSNDTPRNWRNQLAQAVEPFLEDEADSGPSLAEQATNLYVGEMGFRTEFATNQRRIDAMQKVIDLIRQEHLDEDY